MTTIACRKLWNSGAWHRDAAPSVAHRNLIGWRSIPVRGRSPGSDVLGDALFGGGVYVPDSFTTRRWAAGSDEVGVQSATEAVTDYRDRPAKEIRILVVGSTGYIGKFVVRELIRRGYSVTAFAREKSGIDGASSADQTRQDFEGADVLFGDVTDPESLRSVAFASPVDVVISCLASRTGGKKDSWLIDYEATLNTLQIAREKGAAHFVLLSAICVQKPLLEFQRAKLKFEDALAVGVTLRLVHSDGSFQSAGDISYSIVRPTAFFKSLSGQVESVKKGGPYVMFGDGKMTACKPMSESDLASFIADAVVDKNMVNKILPIGGPGEALTPLDQAAILFKHAARKEKTINVPIGIMDGIIGIFEWLEQFFPNLEDTVEFARIGRYYATESMLVWDAERGVYDADQTPSYGTHTLDAFFKKAVEEGLKGQELGDQAVFGSGK